MLRSSGFTATMTKHSFVVKNDNVFVCLAIKHTSIGDVQHFLESFEKELKTTNIDTIMSYPVRWSKTTIDTDDYDQYMEVEFADIVFVAKLTSINISRSTKDGSDVFDYILNFRKDVEGDNKDSITAKTYLKYKEENEDGKKVIVQFPVGMKLTEAPASAQKSTGKTTPDKSTPEEVF